MVIAVVIVIILVLVSVPVVMSVKLIIILVLESLPAIIAVVLVNRVSGNSNYSYSNPTCSSSDKSEDFTSGGIGSVVMVMVVVVFRRIVRVL